MELLLDFYGQVLTERQRSAVELYCGEDYSLSEIAQEEGISRQGVRDALVRAEKALTEMEDRLQLVSRYLELKSGLRRVCVELERDVGRSLRRTSRTPCARCAWHFWKRMSTTR